MKRYFKEPDPILLSKEDKEKLYQIKQYMLRAENLLREVDPEIKERLQSKGHIDNLNHFCFDIDEEMYGKYE